MFFDDSFFCWREIKYEEWKNQINKNKLLLTGDEKQLRIIILRLLNIDQTRITMKLLLMIHNNKSTYGEARFLGLFNYQLTTNMHYY